MKMRMTMKTMRPAAIPSLLHFYTQPLNQPSTINFPLPNHFQPAHRSAGSHCSLLRKPVTAPRDEDDDDDEEEL
jgi:hypothetical protein